MKIIFLDVDGVLVTSRSHLAFGSNGGSMRAFDKVGVALIKRLCDRSGAKIVISSSWRMSEDNPINLLDIFYWQGLHSDYFFMKDVFTPKVYKMRRVEIDMWLENHKGEIDSYVIFDDDVEPDENSCVTNFDDGILYKHYTKALKILTGEDLQTANSGTILL